MGKKMLIVSVSILLIVAVWLVFFRSTANAPAVLGQRSQILSDRAQNVFESLKAGDYQNATRDFNSGLKAQIHGKFDTLIAKAGPLKEYSITREGAIEDNSNHIYGVYITCKFERGTLWGIVNFDRQKQITRFSLYGSPHR